MTPEQIIDKVLSEELDDTDFDLRGRQLRTKILRTLAAYGYRLATTGPGIQPTEADIGRPVVYTGNRYPGGKLELGVITGFNNTAVFVRYGSSTTSKATNRSDLEWEVP